MSSALLLVLVTAAPLPPGISVQAAATVEIVRAERADELPGPGAVQRQVRVSHGAILIEFS